MGNCVGVGTPVNHYQTPTTSSAGFASRSSNNSSENNRLPSPRKLACGRSNDVVVQRVNKTTAETVPSREIPPPPPTPPSLKIFKLADLKSATRNFRPDTVLGEGGFGTVFKGWIDEQTFAPSKAGFGMPVAVKRANQDSSQGLEEWQAEVKFLGKFGHQNLVKLLGYCSEDNQFLLVYEYMPKGSLESHLFRST
ncbi:Probable serine/threonine-protein kinase PBL10 [Linum grandiflorum]